MSDTQTPSERITKEVTSWPGVVAGMGDRGEWGFSVGRRQIGHLHGDRVAHFVFPKEVGADLHAAGRIGPHPVAPDKPAWGARKLETDEDVDDVIAMMRMNYDRVIARYGAPAETEPAA